MTSKQETYEEMVARHAREDREMTEALNKAEIAKLLKRY